MITFKDYFLNESVTLRVASAGEPAPEGVLDVIHAASRFIWYKSRWSKEAPEWLGDMSDWSPDTSHHSYNDPKGSINWYPPKDVPEKAQRQIIQDVATHIQEAGLAEVINVRKERSRSTDGTVYRIDIEVSEPEEESAPEMQMSNRNAYEILHNVLDVRHLDGGYEEIDARDLLFRIEAIVDEIDIRAGTIEPKDERGEGGARIIDPGMDQGHIEKRLEYIKKIAKWALENGYSKLIAN